MEVSELIKKLKLGCESLGGEFKEVEGIQKGYRCEIGDTWIIFTPESKKVSVLSGGNTARLWLPEIRDIKLEAGGSIISITGPGSVVEVAKDGRVVVEVDARELLEGLRSIRE